jgi:ACS family hexuronate transporter-like MFS transporter
VAVPLIAFLGAGLGWRAAFVITGSLGLLWVIPWMWLFRFSSDSPGVTDQAHGLAAGRAGGRAAHPEGESEGQRWKLMLADPNTWRFTLARLLTDPVWYFFLFWFPKYLISEHAMSLIRVGEFAWVVYLAAGTGTILGGWASGLLIKRGVPIVAARKRIMLIAACIVPLSPLIAFAPAIPLVLSIASFVVLAQLAWQVTLGTLIIDVYPQRFVATVFGIIATGGGLGGLLSTNAIGHLVTHFSYKPVYILMAFLHPCALFVLWQVRAASSPNVMEAK